MNKHALLLLRVAVRDKGENWRAWFGDNLRELKSLNGRHRTEFLGKRKQEWTRIADEGSANRPVEGAEDDRENLERVRAMKRGRVSCVSSFQSV